MYKLSAVKREQKGEKVRKEGLLPAVIYGGEGETVSLSLSPTEFEKIFNDAGESSLVDLTIDNKAAGQVLIYDYQNNPVTGRLSHVDFKRVIAGQLMTATVELKLVGEPPAVKEFGGTLVHNLDDVEIECLPKDLMHDIVVDLSVLKTFDDVIHVSDLKVNDGVKIIEPSANTVVAKVAPSLTEEQIKAMEESGKQADVNKVEGVADKEKPEDVAAAAKDKDKKASEKKDEKKK
jgi:large subunit ribosomal protein L25